MSNYCEIDANVRGKKKDIMTLIKWLKADFDYVDENNQSCYTLGPNNEKIPCEHHVGFKVWDIEMNDTLDEFEDDDIAMTGFFGGCAWSASSSLINVRSDDGHKFVLGLPEACRLLHLEVEMFTKEPGMGFSEHYYINDEGVLGADESTDLDCTYIGDYETYEDYVNDSCELNVPITKQEFEEADSEYIERCEYFDGPNGFFQFQFLF